MLIRTEPDDDSFHKATYILSDPTDTSTLLWLKKQPTCVTMTNHRKITWYIQFICSFHLAIKHLSRYKQRHLAPVKWYWILREGKIQFTSMVREILFILLDALKLCAVKASLNTCQQFMANLAEMDKQRICLTNTPLH